LTELPLHPQIPPAYNVVRDADWSAIDNAAIT
jgi:hypothetical protein